MIRSDRMTELAEIIATAYYRHGPGIAQARYGELCDANNLVPAARKRLKDQFRAIIKARGER